MLGHVGGFETQTYRERPIERPRVGGLAPWRARQVERFIDENLSAALSVARIATFSGVGPGYFGRACKDTFGLAPRALITHKRLARAKLLMATTDEPLNQIALACGFADQSHFTNRFRRLEGVTPTVWRRGARAL
jgi:AraC-like DNA-binding protein